MLQIDLKFEKDQYHGRIKKFWTKFDEFMSEAFRDIQVDHMEYGEKYR